MYLVFTLLISVCLLCILFLCTYQQLTVNLMVSICPHYLHVICAVYSHTFLAFFSMTSSSIYILFLFLLCALLTFPTAISSSCLLLSVLCRPPFCLSQPSKPQDKQKALKLNSVLSSPSIYEF